MKYKERQQLAKRISQFAKEELARRLESMRRHQIDESTIRHDCKQFRELAKIVRTKSVQAAYIKAQYMDTFLRDCIPNDIWEALENN